MNAGLLLWAMERGARSDAFGARRGVVKLTFLSVHLRNGIIGLSAKMGTPSCAWKTQDLK